MILKFNFADILVHETNIVYETCQLKNLFSIISLQFPVVLKSKNFASLAEK